MEQTEKPWQKVFNFLENSIGFIVLGVFVFLIIGVVFKPDPMKRYVQHERSSSDKDCSDFSSQSAAQLYFIENGGVENDIDNLDKDGNGVACESLF